jgi:predicted transcriptional regulator
LAIASGLLPLIVFGSFGNIWNLLLGWFLLQNAGRAAQYASVQEQLTGLTAADAVNPDSPVIFADLSLREFADQRILSPQQWRKYLVINQTGQLLGEVAVDDLKTIPNPLWPSTQIADLVRPIEPSRLINSDQSLLEVIGHLDEQKLSALAVIRRDTGILVGLLEKSSVLQSMKPRAQATPV